MTTPTNDAPTLQQILEDMVENTHMILTNDLPSLLDQERVAKLRRVHKNEILKNLPEALTKLQNREIVAERYGRVSEHNVISGILTNEELAKLSPATIKRLKARRSKLQAQKEGNV